ncbi:PspA/IM30 family protein [Streptomyces sp. DT24]|uniref:PspA/IM30 family protein n=1 Tax=Streptomyces sp. DT24 TaxID=3416520 RepID=UPI003CEAE108
MPKQTVLGRVTLLAKADINALVDQAEDRRTMLDQLIHDYTTNLMEAGRAAADALGDLSLMEQDHAEDVELAREWGEKALAVSRRADGLRAAGAREEADGFDKLARIALGRQLDAEKEVQAAEPTITCRTQVLERLNSGLAQMRAKLSQLTELAELAERAEPAAPGASTPVRGRTTRALRSIDILDPSSELRRFEEKVRHEEKKAPDARERPTAASPDTRSEELDARTAELDARFDELDGLGGSAEVEARLAALKTANPS